MSDGFMKSVKFAPEGLGVDKIGMTERHTSPIFTTIGGIGSLSVPEGFTGTGDQTDSEFQISRPDCESR